MIAAHTPAPGSPAAAEDTELRTRSSVSQPAPRQADMPCLLKLPEKVVLQCMPLDDATAQAVYLCGGNPMLEVTCR